MTKIKRANLITMGCSKNLVDSEKLAWQLQQQGWDVDHEAEYLSHDVVFINTCGFINDAKTESIEMILDVIDAKKAGNVANIVVFGCLVARYRDELMHELPEVDLWTGNYTAREMMQLLSLEAKEEAHRFNAGPGHYAYLKLAEGCSRRCAFCAIPLIKGQYVSRQPEDILAEAGWLASQGVKELLLIAQDLSCYGKDIKGDVMLPQLLKAMTKTEGVRWIRLHYLYPDTFPMEVLDMMQRYPEICRYLDIPLQHISDPVLKKMHRGTNRKAIETILKTAREKVPGIAIRTTMLVGHPGETEADFEALLDFVKTWKFDRLGVFTYSEEAGTRGADLYDDNIPEEVKQKRAETLMQVQDQISLEANSKMRGTRIIAVIDRREGMMLVGRSEKDSVEVDNEIVIDSDTNIEPGTFCEVEVTAATAHELEAKLIKILD